MFIQGRTCHESPAETPGPVYPHPFLQAKMRLLRLLLPAPQREPHGRLCGRPVRPPHRNSSLRRRTPGGHRLFRRRHSQLPGGKAAGENSENHCEALPGIPGGGDHPGGQPRLRRRLEGPEGPAEGRLQPHLPGDAVRLRPGTAKHRPNPHHGSGAPGGGGRPEGPVRQPLPGPHLRPARPDPPALDGEFSRRRGPGAGAPELLRPEGGGGHPPLCPPGHRGPPR